MAEWAEGSVEANGINLHYYRGGAAGQPPLLLLHGITDSGRVWTRIARDLGTRYDIVMTDARGHGLSDNLATGFSIRLLADDAAGVIGALGLAPAYLWGHSMGAITAATVAAHYPALVRAAVLEDPPLFSDPAPPAPPPRPAGPDFRALSPAERIAAGAALNPGWHADEIPPWAESKAQVDPAVMEHIAAFREFAWRDVLRAIRCPVLLLTGDPAQGALVTPATAEEARRLLAAGEVGQIAGAGHNIHRDRYAETMAAVLAFLGRH